MFTTTDECVCDITSAVPARLSINLKKKDFSALYWPQAIFLLMSIIGNTSVHYSIHLNQSYFVKANRILKIFNQNLNLQSILISLNKMRYNCQSTKTICWQAGRGFTLIKLFQLKKF